MRFLATSCLNARNLAAAYELQRSEYCAGRVPFRPAFATCLRMQTVLLVKCTRSLRASQLSVSTRKLRLAWHVNPASVSEVRFRLISVCVRLFSYHLL